MTMTMTTAATLLSTTNAALRRQLHAYTSQVAVPPSLRKRPVSVQWVLSQQQSPSQNLTLNWQQQRHHSDQFRPRAISAFKSKKYSVHDADDPKVLNAGSIQRNHNKDDVESDKQQNDDGLPAAPSTASDNSVELPTVSTTLFPSNTATDNVSNNQEKNEDNHTITDQTNNPNTIDSNPWAHMHLHEFAPKIVVVGVGGAGTNAVNNMVSSGLAGVTFLALNTDAQHLSKSLSQTRLQIGTHLTSGLGCGANPDAGRLAAEESKDAIQSCIEDAHMVFITAGMGGGTGTGAAPVVAGICYDLGILTVSVVTTPFRFEGTHRMRLAVEGVDRLKGVSDTLIVVPNQNLFRLVGETTSFMDSFKLADDVLLAGVRSITDLMTSPGMINLDFADVQSVMHGMGNALLGTGQACNDEVIGNSDFTRKNEIWNAYNNTITSSVGGAENECRAIRAAKMALNNPLLSEGNMDIGSAKGMLVNMTGGTDMTLFEVDRAATYITERVRDPEANIIFGSAFDANLTGCVRVSVVATGIDEAE